MEFKAGDCLIVKKNRIEYIGVISEDLTYSQFTGISKTGAIMAIPEKFLNEYEVTKLIVKL